jgi:hypothetical protein
MKCVEQKNCYSSLSELFTTIIMKLLVETGDVVTARLFCQTLLPKISKPLAVLPSLVCLLKAFSWSDIGDAALAGIAALSSALEVVLKITETLLPSSSSDDSATAAGTALLQLAVDKVKQLDEESFLTATFLELLWANATMCPTSKTSFHALVASFKKLHPRLMGFVVAAFSKLY